MVSGVASSRADDIRTAHIIPALSDLQDITKLNLKEADIYSVRNGLLLAQNIEMAFDAFEISFVKLPLSTNTLVMKFWNPASPWKAKPLFADCSSTIGDFEGQELKLGFVDGREGHHVPFLRGLAYQAFQAYTRWLYRPGGSITNAPDEYRTSDDALSVFNRERLLNIQYQAIRDAELLEQQQLSEQADDDDDDDDDDDYSAHLEELEAELQLSEDAESESHARKRSRNN